MNKLTKLYQLWYKSDYGYHLVEADTLEEIFEEVPHHYTNDFYVTKKCDIEFKES